MIYIVILHWNNYRCTDFCLESLRQITYKNAKIIIIDNKSTDGTWNKALELQNTFKDKVKIYQNSENIGPVLNWKRGIEYACGDYIKLLFSDDIIELNFIEETMHIFTEDCAFVMSGI